MNETLDQPQALKSDALFIPLRREYFKAFEQGEKTIEYRKAGPRWHSGTCRIGRRVTLSLGYSGSRLHGFITDFYVDTEPGQIPGWRECYGDYAGDAACIVIAVDPLPPVVATFLSNDEESHRPRCPKCGYTMQGRQRIFNGIICFNCGHEEGNIGRSYNARNARLIISKTNADGLGRRTLDAASK